jgi:hypothetical protein
MATRNPLGHFAYPYQLYSRVGSRALEPPAEAFANLQSPFSTMSGIEPPNHDTARNNHPLALPTVNPVCPVDKSSPRVSCEPHEQMLATRVHECHLPTPPHPQPHGRWVAGTTTIACKIECLDILQMARSGSNGWFRKILKSLEKDHSSSHARG